MAESSPRSPDGQGDGIPESGPDRARATLAAGSLFGHYLIERLLGVGGMGEVYLARDTRLHRPVALKLLGGEFLSNDDVMRRFSQEAMSASALHDESIPVVYETGEFDTRRYIASEFIDGEPLSQRLRKGPLPWREAVEVALSVAHALQAAHGAGIIHRDIKPGNILVCRDGRAKLVDFGIAKMREPPTEPGIRAPDATRLGVVLGTPGYMSPEQGMGLPADARSDLWSLCGVLHEMLTGRRAGVPPTPAQPAPHVPMALRAVVEHGLRPDPAARFQSATAFVLALRRARSRTLWFAGLHPAMVAGLLVLLASAVGYTGWHAGRVRVTSAPPSLVVLPFDNLGSSSEGSYFTSGIQDEILAHLARLSGLTVLSRHAAKDLPSHPADLHAVAARLNVGAALEGSVQLSGERVRVAVQLVDTGSGTQLWADSYNRDRREVFEVERDVAEQVALHLQATLLPAERAAEELPDTRNAAAHAALLQGNFFLAHGDQASLQKAVENYRRSIQLDPAYALAYAQLSIALGNLSTFEPAQQLSRYVPEMHRVAEQAVQLGPQLPEAHVALGWVLLANSWDLEGARREFEAAARIAPNSARAKNGLGLLYISLGLFDRAGPLFEEARRLDPVSGGFTSNLALVRWAQGRLQEAEQLMQASLELEPDLANSHRHLGLIALERGDRQEALRQARLESAPDGRDFMLALLEQQGGDPAAAERLLHRYIATYQTDAPFFVALLYAYRGDADATFAWLERAYTSRDAATLDFAFMRPLYRFRDDPRYAAFAQRLGVRPAA